MAISELENYLENSNKSQFTNQDFRDFRVELLQYANSFYKDKILDFSEASLGGMLLDFAAIVGDSLVYYAEQQFNELDYQTATDPINIQKHLRRANIKNSTASPSSVNCTFSIEVLKDDNSKDFDPKPIYGLLPVIKKGTTITSLDGINFILQEDVDFSSNYIQEVGEENEDGSIHSLFLSKKGICISGNITEEVFSFADDTGDFFISRELENENVTSIISVIDEDGNEYFEVDYLTQTTVFKKVEDSNENYITIVPAPRRFIVERSFLTGKSVIRFGNGDGKQLKENVFTNPEDLLLPLKNKEVISRIDLDPSLLLKNDHFGISPKGKTVLVRYKHGGGESHNLPPNTIVKISQDPIVIFPNLNEDEYDEEILNDVILSLSATNETSSIGGSQPLTLEKLKEQIPNAIKSQSRIVTYEDLIARILTMPTDFGRINKAAAIDNQYSSSTKDLYIICKNSDGYYVEANDAIKTNLSTYLNDFRVIGDNFNILDVPVFNFGIKAKIKLKAGFDPFNVLIDINDRIIQTMRFDLFEIGTPININSIFKVIDATNGVENIITPKKSIIVSKSVEDSFFDADELTNMTYNENVFNPQVLYKDGFIYPPIGGIFEMRYTLRDIVIKAG